MTPLLYIGQTKAPEWAETRWVLSNFAKNKKIAQKNYKDFVDKADSKRLEKAAKNFSVVLYLLKDNKSQDIAIYLARDLS